MGAATMPNRRRIPRLHFLPVAILAAVMGLAYLLGDPQRTSSPSFAYAKSVAPMHVWGVVFLVGAVAVGSAALLRDGTALAFALFVGGCIFAWWASCFLVSALSDPAASLTGWAIHGFIAFTLYRAALEVRLRGIT